MSATDPTGPLAVSIARAAEMIGISRSQIYKEFIWTGELPTADLGARGKSVLVDDLQAAIRRRANRSEAA